MLQSPISLIDLFRVSGKRAYRMGPDVVAGIVAVAIRLYLVNARVPSDQYGTSIGTVRSGGSSLFSGLSGLSGSGNHRDVEEMGEFR